MIKSIEARRFTFPDQPEMLCVVAYVQLENGYEIKIPAVWNTTDFNNTGTLSASELLLNLLENWINVISDTAQMRQREGYFADV